MSDNEDNPNPNLEIRVCLVGEAGVGKKSIISRFKMLNASQTYEGGKNKDNKTATNTDQEMSKSMNETFFSKKYSQREKKKLLQLIDFSKVLTISDFNIELKFFPISAADNIEVGDKINEEDEALKEHKMKFDNIKVELEKILMKQPTVPNAEVMLLFLFVIDLGDFDYSFEKIKVYYEELDKYMNIDKHYQKALIGNKVDVKEINFDRESLEKFNQAFGFHYYEVSTRMFFNFEKFFEKLFFDLFENQRKGFRTKYFKERFNYIMTYRPTFTRSERTGLKPNNYPGPNEYNANIYNFSTEEVKPVFGKDRFKKKIFVNKKGPVFDFKKEVFMKKQTQKSQKPAERNDNKRQQTEEKEDFETTEKKRRLKEEMFGHNPGFSLGIKPSSLKYRKKRKNEYKQMMRSFENIFDLDNITNPQHEQKSPRPMSTESSNKAVIRRKEMILKQRVEKLKQKSHSKIPDINNQDKPRYMQKLNASTSQKLKLTDDSDIEDSDTGRNNKKNNKPPREIRARSHRIVKKDPFIVPGPASYDIRGKISLNKGFTFGGRYNLGDKKNNYGPGYIYLESDIDQMMKQPKFAFKKSYAPRFKEPALENPGDVREIEAKLKFMQENRIHEMNKNFYKVRDLHRKREEALIRKAERDDMKIMKIQDGIMNKYEKENMKRMNKGLPPLDHNTVNYNLVEESAPMYSIKGRYEKGFLGIQENYEDPTKLHGLEQSVSYLSKNLTKNLNPLPKYSAVKPNLPSYSMPKAERFVLEEYQKMPGPNAYFADNFGELEKKPGAPNRFMGLSKREKGFKYSEIPGPGQYKIPGFTDNLLREVEKRGRGKGSPHSGKGSSMGDEHVHEMMDMLDNMNNSNKEDMDYHESGEVSLDQ